MKSGHLRLLLSVLALISLASAYNRAQSPRSMAESARAFLASLDEKQLAKAAASFDESSRQFWHFIPSPDVAKRYGHPRPGLTLREMTDEQRHLAGALLSAGLSREGYRKARTIMSLEEVLRVLEGGGGERRDPLRYHFTVFGDPSEEAPWGYRVEGHHVSLHYAVVGGKLAGAPSFFGSNPREILTGPRKGLRALSREEDLGRELVKSLDEDQRSAALVSETAYRDILTGADRKAVLEGRPRGLPVGELTRPQRKILDELVSEYAANMPGEIEAFRLGQYRNAGDAMHFAWAGGVEPGDPHYYRLQAPEFLIEYDCTQDRANHIHSVWRDWDGDFGLDLLADHYRTAHLLPAGQ